MLGTVQINNLNLVQGPLTAVENYLLFIGRGAGENEGSLISVNSATDLDAVLGLAQSNLKTQVAAAQANAGQNWNAAVLPLAESADWQDGVDMACAEVQFEGIALTDPITQSAQVEGLQSKAESLMARYMSPLFMAAAVRPRADSESWEEYLTFARGVTSGLTADQVTLTASLWGPELGAYMGRLANKSVTVADTPMRVKTGPLVGEWSDKPKDASGRALDMAVLTSLDKARISVPQWYPGYTGIYWGDGNVLDVDGGDFQTIENLRVIQKCMRRVYPLAVARIGDRTLNETPESIAAAKMAFARPLREMSKTRKVLGIPFPGEIHPPTDSSVSIIWHTKYSVEIWITARPYNCPKDITCNLLLDLENYGA